MYNNFVKAASLSEEREPKVTLIGKEANKLYIEEINNTTRPSVDCNKTPNRINSHKRRRDKGYYTTDREIFIAAQNNDVDLIKQVLEENPTKINLLDEFGWSLLMIACQANSVEVVKELLDRGIDSSVRDKAGNSAQNLVIRKRNLAIVDLLLGQRKRNETTNSKHKRRNYEEYLCESCNNIYTDKEQHLSSTIHNINVSKNKEIPTCYKIPESNRGFQMMLRTGWNKESGLGSDGSGIKYPVKPVAKKDRKGLGHKIVEKKDSKDDNLLNKNKKLTQSECYKKKQMEIHFRREFY